MIRTKFIFGESSFDCYGNRMLTVCASNNLAGEFSQSDSLLTRARQFAVSLCVCECVCVCVCVCVLTIHVH